jgi:hypothetical protein
LRRRRSEGLPGIGADPGSGKVFCISEAPSAEAVIKVHTRNGIPPAEIHELSLEV